MSKQEAGPSRPSREQGPTVGGLSQPLISPAVQPPSLGQSPWPLPTSPKPGIRAASVCQQPEAESGGFRLSGGKGPSASPGGQVWGWEEPGLCMGHAGDSSPLPHNDHCPAPSSPVDLTLALKVSAPVPAGAPVELRAVPGSSEALSGKGT